MAQNIGDKLREEYAIAMPSDLDVLAGVELLFFSV